ncbi:MAG: response regulator [Coriobacteriia bacterium]|nr:response regulator [Coriobacteriia bacterium]
MTSGKVRMVHTFRNGAECLRALALDDPATRRLVIIDTLISDISSLNLCDAIRLAHPHLGIIVVTQSDDVAYVQRAMLAGARGTIARQASKSELHNVLERVSEVASLIGGSAAQSAGDVTRTFAHLNPGEFDQRAVVVPVIGARGGAGKSTIASALAYLAAQANINTALVDFDLQFGDLSFLFGATGQQFDQHATTCGGGDLAEFVSALVAGHTPHSFTQGHSATRAFRRQLAPNLWLYAPRAAAEKAESLAQALPLVLQKLQQEHQLLVINTGAYWTLFHAELLERSDLALCVFDQTVVGVRATTELKNVCRRLGIPASRLLFAMNRARQSGLRAEEIAQVLGADQVFSVREAGPELAILFDSGQLDQLFEQGTFMAELFVILDEIAVRSDLNLHDTAAVRYAMRRDGGARLTTVHNNGSSDGSSIFGGSGDPGGSNGSSRRKGLLRRAPLY